MLAFLRKKSAKRLLYLCKSMTLFQVSCIFKTSISYRTIVSNCKTMANQNILNVKCLFQSQFLNSLKKNLGLVFISRVERVTLSKSSLKLCMELILFLNMCKPVLYDHFMTALLESTWVVSTDTNLITSQQCALAEKVNSNHGQSQQTDRSDYASLPGSWYALYLVTSKHCTQF